MSAVELTEGQEVEQGDENPEPGCDPGWVDPQNQVVGETGIEDGLEESQISGSPNWIVPPPSMHSPTSEAAIP